MDKSNLYLNCDDCDCAEKSCLKYSKFLKKETMFILEVETDNNFKFKCTPVSISKHSMLYIAKDGPNYYGAIKLFNRIKSAVRFNLKDNHSSDNGECWKPKLVKYQK